MVRLEFIKGEGGVTNIVNGNLRDTDRNSLLNIEDADRIIVSFYSAIAINVSLIAIEISGYVVVFDTLENMQIYLDQIDLLDGETFNPGINGLMRPSWDVASRDKTEGVQSHTYLNTDIEQDLINN